MSDSQICTISNHITSRSFKNVTEETQYPRRICSNSVEVNTKVRRRDSVTKHVLPLVHLSVYSVSSRCVQAPSSPLVSVSPLTTTSSSFSQKSKQNKQNKNTKKRSLLPISCFLPLTTFHESLPLSPFSALNY